ncbi:MAG: DNA-binding protein [Alphaproteobacteria bacterium]|nr:DNA-binding protein [Alphaproteobacteria bacterium]
MTVPANPQIADRLREVAALLEEQGANPFRVAAYRRAADTVAGWREDVAAILAERGFSGLDALPGVGPAIAAGMEELLRTGRWQLLERLRGAADPESVFATIPGMGPALARRLHDGLHVDTLEALEVAAHDGRLDAVPGIGPRRAAMIRAGLGRMLARVRPVLPRHTGTEPPVALLIEVDREYRERGSALPTIAPRRLNPEGKSWLPILHTERAERQFTALYSNTARAHEVGRTHDWVVIYFHSDHRAEGQRTVVTETHGTLIGRRVVRGREGECRDFYRTLEPRAVSG